jgi:monovalent cation:H+ antiporter-2, CPA2 family
MIELAPFIVDLTIILGVAGLTLLICQQLRQPIVLGYLIAGMIVGPHTPPHSLITNVEAVKTTAELGVIFLMFSLGIEFSFHKLKKIGAPASITGIIEVFFMLVSGYGFGKLLGWTNIQSLFLGATLAISSTTIIIKTFNDLKLNKSAFAELVFGVLIIEDLLAILMLVGLSTFAINNNDSTTLELFHAVVRLLLTVGGWFIIGYFLIPSFFRAWLRSTSDEILMVVAVALCLGLVCLAAYFHYSVALGAFIMGSILAETEEARRIEHLVRPLRDIFAAVFFISVGMLIDPQQIWNNLGIIALICLFTIISKLIFSFLGAWLSGQSTATSLKVGFSMAQIGEFSFIIAGLGVTFNVLTQSFYPIIVAISLITSFTTPYFIKFSATWLGAQHNQQPKRSLFRNEDTVNVQLDLMEPYYFKSCATRFMLNAILVAIMFICTETLFTALLATHINIKYASWALIFFCTYLPAAPFIWAGLHAGHIHVTPPNKKAALLACFICSALISSELYLLTHTYFVTFWQRMSYLILALLASLIFHKAWKKSYAWLELHLKNNLKKT